MLQLAGGVVLTGAGLVFSRRKLSNMTWEGHSFIRRAVGEEAFLDSFPGDEGWIEHSKV